MSPCKNEGSSLIEPTTRSSWQAPKPSAPGVPWMPQGPQPASPPPPGTFPSPAPSVFPSLGCYCPKTPSMVWKVLQIHENFDFFMSYSTHKITHALQEASLLIWQAKSPTSSGFKCRFAQRANTQQFALQGFCWLPPAPAPCPFSQARQDAPPQRGAPKACGQRTPSAAAAWDREQGTSGFPCISIQEALAVSSRSHFFISILPKTGSEAT